MIIDVDSSSTPKNDTEKLESFSSPMINRHRRGFLIVVFISCLSIVCLILTIETAHAMLATAITPSELLTTSTLEILGWEKGVSRDPKMYIDPNKDTTIISGRQICENPETEIVIIVLTKPERFMTRTTIRQTWGSENVSNTKIGFFIGLAHRSLQSSIEEESQTFKDIIQENLVDTYNNLTLKSIALLKWFVRNCLNSSKLVKADDDTYVDISLLVGNLIKIQSSRLLIGQMIQQAKVHRNISSFSYTPKYMFQNDTFPDFLSGGESYTMSRDVAVKLFAAAMVTPIFHLEDVYVTGICAQKAGIRRRRFTECKSLRFPNAWLAKYPAAGFGFCTVHPLSPQELIEEWNKRHETLLNVITLQSLQPAHTAK